MTIEHLRKMTNGEIAQLIREIAAYVKFEYESRLLTEAARRLEIRQKDDGK